MKEIQFSQRLPTDLTANPLYATDDGADVIDLTASNPTQAQFTYPDTLWTALATPAPTYAPQALGLMSARTAVAEYLQSQGHPIAPEHVALTASTSEAYGMLLKMFCDPGDSIAVSAPSYPLVHHLAELEGVRVQTYALEYAHAWHIDTVSLEACLQQGAKLVVVIAPNNPTGSSPDASTCQAIAQLCGRYGAPLLVDDVFAPYYFTTPNATAAHFAALAGPVLPLCFVLNGLSKALALPQYKLGWIAVHGTTATVQAALTHLEWIADAYLSVASAVQLALPALLPHAPLIQGQIRERTRANRTLLAQALHAVHDVQLATATGGWYAVLRVPQTVDDDALAIQLLRQAQLRVHPGYFYDFAAGSWLVLGLLLPTPTFTQGVQRLVPALQGAM